jgi:pimeloyl-ACP methyl ester carboxylesterase
MPILATLRFRFFITLAMRIISLRDEIYLRSAAKKGIHPRSFRGDSKPLLSAFSGEDHILQAASFQPSDPPIAAVLIFHGIGERLAYWQSVQNLLARHGITSLIFHYSGYGKSTGAITPHNLHRNAHAAYAALRQIIPTDTPIFLLGFSMGTAVAADVASHLSPPAQGLILCEAFPTLREAAARIASSPLLSHLLPDIWRTIDTTQTLTQPLLVVHSHSDELFPTSFADSIYRSAKSQQIHPVELFITTGFSHNEPYQNPRLSYWQPILDFISRHAALHANASSLHAQTPSD